MLLIPPCEVDIIATLLTYSNAGIAQSAKIGDGLKQDWIIGFKYKLKQ